MWPYRIASLGCEVDIPIEDDAGLVTLREICQASLGGISCVMTVTETYQCN